MKNKVAKEQHEVISKIFQSFLERPTKENIERLNRAAEEYNSFWIESMASGNKVNFSNINSKKSVYERIAPSKEDFDAYRKDQERTGPYILLQKRIDVEDPFFVISFRDYYRNVDNPTGRKPNRRFYYIKSNQEQDDMPRAWFFENPVDLLLDKVADAGILEPEYFDHRRPKDIDLKRQFIHSEDLSKDQKISYLREMTYSENEPYLHPDNWFSEDNCSFFDIVDDLSFCIDLYAGDATKGDASNWRKVMFEHDHLYTVRSLTRDKNYRPTKEILRSDGKESEWRIDNAMADISVQTMRHFWNTIID